jgi:hypothetical protein
LLADDQGMAGIVATLEADDGIGAAGEPIDDLAFAFIAPLGADHGYVGQLSAFHLELKPCRALGESGSEGKALPIDRD